MMDQSQGLRALLVEDDPGERWIITEILRSRGHHVVACENAETAWERFEEEPFALALLDWVLPGMDGLELCRRIRRHPKGDRTIVVVVTARDESESLEEVLAAGADDYVYKPIDVGLMNVRLTIAEKEYEEIAKRKEAQEALEAKSREMERFFTNVDKVFFTVDPDAGELIQVSPGSERTLGRTADELRSDPDLWRELLYPPEVQARQDEILGTGSSGASESVVHQYRATTPDGSEIWLEAVLKAARRGGGWPRRIDGIISNVTERQANEEALAARNRELRAVNRLTELALSSESLDEAYAQIVDEISDASGWPVVVVEHTDLSRDHLVVRAARGVELPPDGPVETPFHRSLSGLAAQRGEPVITDDAESSADHGSILRDAGIRGCVAYPVTVRGKVSAILTVATPEVRRPSQRLLRLVGTVATSLGMLIDRVGAHQALVRSEQRYRNLAERLRQANEELEAFAYTVSHDLRAPLRTMEGFAHALLADFGDELPADAQDYVQRIVASGRQSERLITDLLAYSRLSFEEVALDTVELESVVELVEEGMSADIEEAGGTLEVERPLPSVRGHESTLVQVVSNLVSNALKFVAEGTAPEIRIRSETRDGKVRLWVEDNGIGISPAQATRIFRVFERLVESGNRPGTGIGLAIVRRGMDRIGGSAGVEAGDDRGSRFWIELPSAD